jgi:hypothetical protein
MGGRRLLKPEREQAAKVAAREMRDKVARAGGGRSPPQRQARRNKFKACHSANRPAASREVKSRLVESIFETNKSYCGANGRWMLFTLFSVNGYFSSNYIYKCQFRSAISAYAKTSLGRHGLRRNVEPGGMRSSISETVPEVMTILIQGQRSLASWAR